jgi:cobaltochelatase CobS
MNRIISQTKLDLANGECIVKNDKFILIATANTTGDGGDSKYRGRCAIDKATIDRFIMQDVKYDDSLELELCNGIVEIMKFHKQIRKWIDKEELDYLVTPRTSEQLYTLLFYTKISLDNALKKTTFKG